MNTMMKHPRRWAFLMPTLLLWTFAIPALAAEDPRGYQSGVLTGGDPSGDPSGALPATGIDLEITLIVGLCMLATGLILASVARGMKGARQR